MTKSFSAILQESLCSEENFSEEVEYESDMLTNLQVRIKFIMRVCFDLVCGFQVHVHVPLYGVFPTQIRKRQFFQKLSS